MEVEFKSDVYDQLETDPNFNGGYSAAIVKAYRKRLQVIRAAQDERVFYNMRSLHFEQLKGKRAGQYSMRLNDQWRLILEFKKQPNKTVVIIDIEDYH